MSDAFVVHPRLAQDTFALAELQLSRVVLMNDRRFPWMILIPRRSGAREIHALPQADRQMLIEEIADVAAVLERATGAQKMNIGALGNLVPQLHIHVVARFEGDAAWPGPVWGSGKAQPYDDAARAALCARLAKAGLQLSA